MSHLQKLYIKFLSLQPATGPTSTGTALPLGTPLRSTAYIASPLDSPEREVLPARWFPSSQMGTCGWKYPVHFQLACRHNLMLVADTKKPLKVTPSLHLRALVDYHVIALDSKQRAAYPALEVIGIKFFLYSILNAETMLIYRATNSHCKKLLPQKNLVCSLYKLV